MGNDDTSHDVPNEMIIQRILDLFPYDREDQLLNDLSQLREKIPMLHRYIEELMLTLSMIDNRKALEYMITNAKAFKLYMEMVKEAQYEREQKR